MRVVVDHGADSIDILVSLWVQEFCQNAPEEGDRVVVDHNVSACMMCLVTYLSLAPNGILTSSRKKLSYSSFNELKSVAAMVLIGTAIKLQTKHNQQE